MDVVLVAPAAVDIDAAKRLEVVPKSGDEIDRVVLAPLPPALLDHLPRFQVERHAKAVGRARIGIVGRRHAKVHDAVAFGGGELFLPPHVRQEPSDAPVVLAFGEPFALRFAQCVVGAGFSPGQAVLGELVQCVRPVVPVDEIEIRVAGMIGDRAPGFRVLHPVEDRAVAARGFSEAAAVLAGGERPELTVDEGNDLAREVVGVIADRGGVHVLVAAERREAVRKDEDRRAHFSLADKPRRALRDIIAEGLPVRVREARAGEAHQVVEHREAALAAFVILRRQPHPELAHVRIAQGVVLEDPGDEGGKRRFPVLYDLVGFTGSGLAHANWKPFGDNVPERAARLIREGKMGPAIFVFPDCFTALGGNQYVNSAAIGDYADYLTREIVPFVDREFRTLAAREHRGCFGKSSGGYGAILHGMKYAQHWGAIADHSGDSYFDFVYGHDWPNTLAELTRFRASKRKPGKYDALRESTRKGLAEGLDDGRVKRFLEHVWKKEKLSLGEGHAIMNLCMAATYDPDRHAPLGFRLPFNLESGE